ncbi:MAG: hypothetical protein ACYSR3_13160 [Planctomycetota bacterium]
MPATDNPKTSNTATHLVAAAILYPAASTLIASWLETSATPAQAATATMTTLHYQQPW